MATITATVTPYTTPPSVTLVCSGGVGAVQRVQGGVSTPVRGTEDPAWVGTVLDYECPQETVVAYVFAGATSPAVMMPDVGVWMIPAGRPELAVQLAVKDYPSWSRPARMSITEVPGRPNDVVVSQVKRSSRRGSMTVQVRSLTDYATLDACLEITGAMLLSSPARHYPLELRALWVVVGDVDEAFVGVQDVPLWILTLPLLRQDRPEVVDNPAGHTINDLVGPISGLVGTIGTL